MNRWLKSLKLENLIKQIVYELDWFRLIAIEGIEGWNWWVLPLMEDGFEKDEDEWRSRKEYTYIKKRKWKQRMWVVHSLFLYQN